MTTRSNRPATRTAALLCALALLGCQSSDKIAPDGSAISLTASPGTIILSNALQASPITILATVSNTLGLPVPGQDVRFTTTSGDLTPVGGTPVRTDGNGNAATILNNARQNATITAKSGKVSQTLTINTATCQLTTISFNVSSPLNIVSCSDTFDITATATDNTGAACQGIQITFAPVTTGRPATDVKFAFVPGSGVTDASGNVNVQLRIDTNDCPSKCQGGNTCTGEFKATAGSILSAPIDLTGSF